MRPKSSVPLCPQLLSPFSAPIELNDSGSPTILIVVRMHRTNNARPDTIDVVPFERCTGPLSITRAIYRIRAQSKHMTLCELALR